MANLFNYFISLFRRQNPFQDHVNQVLKDNGYTDETEIIERIPGETLFNQRYVFIIVKRNGWFYVLLILDELHRNKIVVKLQRNTPESYIIKNEYFTNENQARSYIAQKQIQYRSGNFDGEAYFYRIVRCVNDRCDHIAQGYDKCFLPGDYLTRDLDGFALASHAGIYCGRDKVVHYDSPDRGATILNCIRGNSNHCVHLAPIANFVTNQSQEIRIVVHCFQQSLTEDKVRGAQELAETGYGLYKYRFISNNCQHFASLIATGRLEMIDQELVRQGVTAVGIGIGVGVFAVGAVQFARYMFGRANHVENNDNVNERNAITNNANRDNEELQNRVDRQ